MSTLLIEKRGGAVRAILMDNGKPVAYAEPENGTIRAGQVYIGCTDRILKGLDAAFIRLPKGETGFLPMQGNAPRSGDALMVQVKKPPISGKQAYLTRDIALAGRYAVLLPTSGRNGVSSRITAPEERDALRQRAAVLAPRGMGLVMRAESADAQDEEIRSEIDGLVLQWNEIRNQAAVHSAPILLLDAESPVDRLIREAGDSLSEIVANDASAVQTALPVTIKENPFVLYNADAKLERSLRRTVLLKSGGTLVTDVCEAMTVIDVNTGKYTGTKAGAEDTVLRLNLEAAREIARLMRLRRVGGIVLADFIDMHTEEARNQVLAVMREALSHDPVKTTLLGYTRLGLLEMTRKREESPLSLLPDAPCPHCGGRGVLAESGEESDA